MKKLLLLFFITSLTIVNAKNDSFADKVKDGIADIKGVTKDKLRVELKKQLDKNCFKMPFFTEYYICPPINPDKTNYL